MEDNGSAVWWCKGHLSTEGEQDVEAEEWHLKCAVNAERGHLGRQRNSIMVLMFVRCWTRTKSTETFICDIM